MYHVAFVGRSRGLDFQTCLTSITIFMKGHNRKFRVGTAQKGHCFNKFLSHFVSIIIPINVSSTRVGVLFILVTAVLPDLRAMLGTQ